MYSWRKNNRLQQPKTDGVLLHKSSDILQYQALGQAHGNILSWRESNPSLQHFINNFSFKMQEWEWAGHIRQEMEIWGRPDAPYQPAELIFIMLWRADTIHPYYGGDNMWRQSIVNISWKRIWTLKPFNHKSIAATRGRKRKSGVFEPSAVQVHLHWSSKK